MRRDSAQSSIITNHHLECGRFWLVQSGGDEELNFNKCLISEMIYIKKQKHTKKRPRSITSDL